MKHLPKHLRPRYRYVAVAIEAWPDADLSRGSFQERLWESIRSLAGDVVGAAVDATVLRFSFADGTGEAVVRVRRGEVERARAGLACLDAVDGQPVGVWVLGVSGTVRACEEKYIGERPEPVTERHVVFGDATRAATARGDLVDVRIDGAFAGATDLDFE